MKTRREMIENCIVRGTLLAGATTLSSNQLLAFWEQGEANAHKPTSTDVLGPFYRKGAPNKDAAAKPAIADAHIWVMRADRPEELSVKLGLSDGRDTEITGTGLAEGLAVIVRANPVAP